MNSSILLARIRDGQGLDAAAQRRLILSLSWPAILAQVSVTIMQLIDAGMAGRLGRFASASIGLVSSTTWLLNGFCSGAVYGFSVQTAQEIGAGNSRRARSLCRQGLLVCALTGSLAGLIGFLLSSQIPVWLGGEAQVLADARAYLGIFCLSQPLVLLNSAAVQMLQACGDTKLPGLSQIAMCVLDVLFNYGFIFILHLGVAGAALGTALSQACSALFLMSWLRWFNPFLKGRASPDFTAASLKKACRIGIPVSIEQLITGTSYVAFTRIVSSLGSVSVAANSFAITAESLCYMPAYGCASAASAIIGQCTGARRIALARELGRRVTRIGIAMMTLSGIVLFCLAGSLLSILTPDRQIAALAASMLRMEAFSEPMYGASIVVNGVLRGKGDTLWPACLNFLSIWCVRIPLAALLSACFGLTGAWLAMGIELNVRGLLFLWRLRHAWKRQKDFEPAAA